MRYRTLLFTGLLYASFLFSCSKTTTNHHCNLATLTDSTTSVQSVANFTYDAQNRITNLVVTGVKGCTRTYTYVGNKVIFNVTDTTAGVLMETDTLMLNSINLISTQSTRFITSGSTAFKTYFYDTIGNPLSSISTVDGRPSDTLIYSTQNGDLIYETVKGQSAHKNDFTYYSGQSFVKGDPTDFRQYYYYGGLYYQNKHMLYELYTIGKSYRGYTYTFTDNRIKQCILRQWTAPDTDTVTHYMNYTYNCY